MEACNKGSSIRSAGRQFGIPESTLRGRLSGCGPRREAHAHQQLLTNEQKSKGLKPKVLEMVGKSPSDEWISKFLKEYPEIRGYKASGLDPKDTAGRQLKELQHLVFFDKGDKSRYALKSDSLVLVTVIEAACADGTMVPPGFILPHGTPIAWWEWEGVGITTDTENGWTNDAICHQWLSKVFIPFTQAHSDPTKPVLLPLDVGIFGPLQCSWVKHCEEMGVRCKEISRESVIPEYMKIRAKSVTKASVHAAFRKSGLWPVDRNIFTNEKFAPSLPFLNSCSCPVAHPSYPAYIPSSPTTKNTGGDTDSDSNFNSDRESDNSPSDSSSHSKQSITKELDPVTPGTQQHCHPSSPLANRGYWTHSGKGLTSTNFEISTPSSNITRLEYLELQAAEAGKIAAEAHCSIQTSRVYDLQEKLNEATKPRHHGAQPNKRAEVLTRPEAKSIFEQQHLQKEAQECEA
ncbi:hypothetical protein M422DRAFT_239305 [Sphaerobolus stellatus SS14]|nr:hypothetical protein M422DRAFT_239305 [Sphaerobolus stellatus SS14]